MMKTYDVSVTISKNLAMPPGAPQPVVAPLMALEEGYPFSMFMLAFLDHCGTHVDAPYHFEPGGAKSDELALDVMVGPARLEELHVEKSIERRDLEGLDLGGVTRLLLKTENSRFLSAEQYKKDFIYLGDSAAEYLVEKGIRLVGVDYWSVDGWSSQEFRTHHALLRHGVVIIELLDLSQVPTGDYELICLPLKVKGTGGAPARVLLREISAT
jgi:arylformamidase